MKVPFSYGNAGYLAHGYASTIHKAQGATVDRALVLLDEDAAREDTYVALSRGRTRNDIYLAASDHRTEEAHGTGPTADPLDDLRRAVRRSGAKRMASDEVPSTHRPTTADLISERDALRRQIGDGPPDPSGIHRRLVDQRTAALDRRDHLERQLEAARDDLDTLGVIARRIQRTQRREIEADIGRLDVELERCDATLAEIDQRLAAIEPSMRHRSEWTEQHRDELRRLADLDVQITITGRLDLGAARSHDRDVGQDLALGL